MGDYMNGKINVLDIDFDNLTAKEAMKQTVGYFESEPVSIIEMMTADGLMTMDELPGLKEDICRFNLVLAGDKTILEAAEITDRRCTQEIETNLFLKMLFRYMHKNHKRVYILVETEEDGQEYYAQLESNYSGIQIAGLAKVSASARADDMLVNAINGAEVDCVISALPAPLQEEFIAKNKNVLNTNIWLGLGQTIKPVGGIKNAPGRLTQFIVKRIFKKEIEKHRRNINEAAF